MRIALGIEYHGGAFCGWQTQPAGCAVQTRSSARCPRSRVKNRDYLRGRTDAGVHALAQVVHFDCAAARPIQRGARH